MTEQRLLELSRRLIQLKSAGPFDCSELLRGELQVARSQEERGGIYGLLAIELQEHGKYDEAEMVIRERIALEPEIPDAWISLALHFLYCTQELDKALSAINVALKKAEAERNFFRHAHLERIRIAIAMKAYSIVEESLIQLINYVPPRGTQDIRLESEFLPRIPQGAVNESVIERYQEKVQAQGRSLTRQ